MLTFLTRRHPQSDRSVDVNPSAILFRDRYDRFEIVVRSKVDVARLQQNDRRHVGRLGEFCGECAWHESALIVDRQIDDVRMAEAKQTYRPLKRSVMSVTRQKSNRWRAGQAARFNIPVTFCQQ